MPASLAALRSCGGGSKVSDVQASRQQGTGAHGHVVDFFPFSVHTRRWLRFRGKENVAW